MEFGEKLEPIEKVKFRRMLYSEKFQYLIIERTFPSVSVQIFEFGKVWT